MKLPVLFRGEIEIDDLPLPAAARSRYFTRATAPEGTRGRTWDAAVRDLTPAGKCFRPGREILIRCEDFYAWIESHPVERDAKPEKQDDADPIDFAAFKRTALRKRGVR